MKSKSTKSILFGVALLAVTVSGCASTPKPLAYLALEIPKTQIKTQPASDLEKQFSRGGGYFLNYGFRPAPEINLYISETAKEANTSILRNADVKCNVPFALDILFFGVNFGTDIVTVAKLQSTEKP